VPLPASHIIAVVLITDREEERERKMCINEVLEKRERERKKLCLCLCD
jgi:hypothetical protein